MHLFIDKLFFFPVQELDTEIFNKLVGEKKSDTVWFIAFTTSNHQQLHTEFKKLAQVIKIFLLILQK